MLDRSSFKKIRRIEIQSKRLVNQLFAGEYRSVFKGQGLEFNEVREYQPGDDIRSIDWNVTARLGRPYIKRYVEERQRTIVLAVDVSASQDYGSLTKSKNEIAAELAAILAFSAIENNDLVSLLLFSDRVERYFPPKKGRKHVLRLINEILNFQRQGKGTDIAQALKYLSRVQRKSAILFLISDFLAGGYEKPILSLSKKHDLIPVWLKDRYEKELPEVASLIYVEDPESGAIAAVDLADKRIHLEYQQAAKEAELDRQAFFKRLKADLIEFSTDGNYCKALQLFFHRREKRLRRG